MPIRTRASDHFCPFLISICAEIHYPWLHLLPPLNICSLAADVQAELTAKMLSWRQPQRAAVTVFSFQTRRKITKVHLHLPPNTSASGMTPSCAEQLGGHLTGNEPLSILTVICAFQFPPTLTPSYRHYFLHRQSPRRQRRGKDPLTCDYFGRCLRGICSHPISRQLRGRVRWRGDTGSVPGLGHGPWPGQGATLR